MLNNFREISTWYDYRRKRFWFLILALLYTIIGFFVLPGALEKMLPDLAHENLQREVSVGKISFNPWTLRLQADDFILYDENRAPMFSFDSLIVNFQSSTIFNLALTFDEISLNGPDINLVRYAFADSNFGRMLNDIEAKTMPAEEPAPADEESGDLRLKIASLAINNGIINLEDDMPSTPFNTRLEPINIAVTDLSTLPDESGTQQVDVTTENGAELSWSGSLELNPLVSSGRIEVSGSPLPIMYRYFEAQLGFTLDNCCFEVGFNYDAKSLPDGEVALSINELEVLLSKVMVNRRGTNEGVFNLPAMRISGGSLAWPEQTAHIKEFVLDQPELYIWVNEDSSINLNKLLLAEAIEAGEDEAEDPQASAPIKDTDIPEAEETPWDISMGEFRIDGMKFGFADRSLPEPGNIEINPINFSLRDISNTPETKSPLVIEMPITSGGQISVNGELTLLPDVVLDTALTVDNLALPVIQPWAQSAARVLIQRGFFNFSGNINSSPADTLILDGDLNIAELKVSDTIKNETLLGWESLSIKKTRLQLDAGTLDISRVKLAEPFSRIIIAADGSTNFQSLATDTEDSSADTPDPDAQGEAATPMKVRIGQTVVKNASVDFSDLSLPLPFRVNISKFGGSMSAIDNQSQQPSILDFEGHVGEYGLTTLAGPVNIMDPTSQADIQFNFRNLNMVDLSPYTAEFAGRKIASGKLNLDLNYAFEDQKLIGDNHIVLADFTLGEEIESENAMSLPLDLALALLKDVNGTIDLDLQISGDMNDPNFSASGIILQTFANLIIKAAASPFKLLGNLIPGGGEANLENIEFLPGRADLTPPEREKLTQISAALLMRPALAIQVDGGYNPAADTQALRKINVDNQLTAITGTDTADDQMPVSKIRKGLEKLTRQQLPDISLRALRKEFNQPDTETGKQHFDELAYTMELRARLEAIQPADNRYLETLASQRSAMIIAQLRALGELDDNRITKGPIAEVNLTENGWVALPMSIIIHDNSREQPLEKPTENPLKIPSLNFPAQAAP